MIKWMHKLFFTNLIKMIYTYRQFVLSNHFIYLDIFFFHFFQQLFTNSTITVTEALADSMSLGKKSN
jgi:hypothetical protein